MQTAEQKQKQADADGRAEAEATGRGSAPFIPPAPEIARKVGKVRICDLCEVNERKGKQRFW